MLVCAPTNRLPASLCAEGVFTQDACVVGRVFVDLNGNRVLDAGEPEIPGVRVVLEDGTGLVVDGAGNYSLCGLRAGTHAVKVDETTLPSARCSLWRATARRAMPTPCSSI
jgi:hypothetical protein